MPVYNLASWVGEAVESILNQTVNDWECIIVDDGSIDDSPRIIDGYAAIDHRIRVIHKSNGGEGSARNAGLEDAHGEWITFLDGDDMWHPQFLETISKGINTVPDAQIVGLRHCDFNDGETISWSTVPDDFERIDFKNELYPSIYCQGCLDCAYRRCVCGDMRFKAYTVGADRSYFNDCLSRTTVMSLTPAVRYAYRQRAGSAIRVKISGRKLCDQISWQVDQLRFWKTSGRMVSSATWIRFGKNLTEWVADDLFKLETEEFASAWRCWFVALCELKGCREISAWQKFVVSVITLTRSKCLAYVLCAVPQRLKSKGFHR